MLGKGALGVVVTSNLWIVSGPGTHYTKDSMKISFCPHSNSHEVTAAKFGTWHGNCTVVATVCKSFNFCIFLAWFSIAQSVCQQAFSLLVNRYLRPWVRILPSAEEDNLSPFDSNIACLCQSIEINNNKHVYRQSQVRKPTGSEVEWAECLLIIGTGCRVQVFSLILDSSVGLSAGIQSAGE